ARGSAPGLPAPAVAGVGRHGPDRARSWTDPGPPGDRSARGTGDHAEHRRSASGRRQRGGRGAARQRPARGVPRGALHLVGAAGSGGRAAGGGPWRARLLPAVRGADPPGRGALRRAAPAGRARARDAAGAEGGSVRRRRHQRRGVPLRAAGAAGGLARRHDGADRHRSAVRLERAVRPRDRRGRPRGAAGLGAAAASRGRHLVPGSLPRLRIPPALRGGRAAQIQIAGSTCSSGRAPPRRTVAGTPTAVACAGTSLTTTALAPICASSPITTGPITRAPAPMVTPSSTVGWRLTRSIERPPSVTP